MAIKFKSSPKIYKNYKSEYPARTIYAAKKSLKKIGIDLGKLKYKGEKVGKGFSIYGGQATYDNKYIASGKGTTYQLSEASVYSEIIERIPLGISPLSPYLKLRKDIHRASFLPGYFYTSRKKIKNSVDIKDLFRYLPSFNLKRMRGEDISRFWADAFSLTEGKYKKTPHLLIRKIAGSNGCASGNTLEEAVSQAFCEVCERHSMIEHVIKKIPAPTIDSKTIKNKDIHKAIDLFNSMNIDVEIKDLTLGNKLPVMGVLFTNQNLAHDKDTLRKRMFYKTLHPGSHLDLNQAIMRCFIEEWQTAGSDLQFFLYHREFDFVDNYFTKEEKEKIVKNIRADFRPLANSTRSFEDFNFLGKDSSKIPMSSLASHVTNDFLDDMEIIKDISQKNNWETFIVDYSIPELPLKVVRVIVPSVSDLFRYNYPSPKKITDFPKQREGYPLDVFFQNKKADIQELISAAEDDLVEKVIAPFPSPLFLKYSPSDILTILKIGYTALGNHKKQSRIDSFFERRSQQGRQL